MLKIYLNYFCNAEVVGKIFRTGLTEIYCTMDSRLAIIEIAF